MQNTLSVLYGTQTGTAKEVAEDLAREAQRRGYSVQLQDLADFNPTELPEKRAVAFVCSTTGQGEVPDGMKAFWLFLLRRSLSPHSLENTHYAVFGLGDSSYVKFNYVSKMLFNRLKQLGGKPMVRRGDGNDQHPFGDFYPWCEELWPKLSEVISPAVQPSVTAKAKLKPRYFLTLRSAADDIEKPPKRLKAQSEARSTYDQSYPFLSTLKENKRLTDPLWNQDVRHLAFDISSSGIQYSTGDVAYILPHNPPDKVPKLLSLLKYNPDTLITHITDEPAMKHIPLPITLFDLFSSYLDFMGAPTRYFFELLSHFSKDPQQAERLAFLSSREGYEELYSYSKKAKRSYFDVLSDFSSASIPIEYIFDFFSPLKPRPFSISSSQMAYPNEIQVSMVTVEYKSPINRIKRGLCSTWLASLDPQQEPLVRLWVKQGTIRFPTDPSVPIVMVGPGTGCAIFRAYLQYRAHWKDQGREVGKAIFFFGCRKESADYLYSEEWKELTEKGVLSTFSVAFSRDQTQKVYVQDKMKDFADEIFEIVYKSEGCFFISGRAEKMPQDVRKVLTSILVAKGGMSEEGAQKYIQVMEQKNRYMTETWA